MAFIRHRGKTYSVVYKILDENGEEHTTSETFATQKEAEKRKKKLSTSSLSENLRFKSVQH